MHTHTHTHWYYYHYSLYHCCSLVNCYEVAVPILKLKLKQHKAERWMQCKIIWNISFPLSLSSLSLVLLILWSVFSYWELMLVGLYTPSLWAVAMETRGGLAQRIRSWLVSVSLLLEKCELERGRESFVCNDVETAMHLSNFCSN